MSGSEMVDYSLPMIPSRNCFCCGLKLDKCMGYVLARDMLKLLSGERIIPRELCGLCALKLESVLEIEYDCGN